MTSTRSFTPTRQGNPCIVCGDIRGKCSQASENLNLCMTFSGHLPGFRYIGQSKDGNWGKYFIDDGTWTQADRDHHYRQQQQLRASRAAAKAKARADALPAMERDRLYRQLLSYFRQTNAAEAVA